MINKSFQLLRTDTALTTNIKLVVDSNYKLYLESFDTNKQLSDQKFKHFLISKNNLYEEQVIKFYDGLSSQLAFDVKYDSDVTNVFSTYNQQFDDIYWSGAKSVEDNWYTEDYEYFAPLFIRKNNLPEGFVVLRVDNPISYEEEDNEFRVGKLSKENFYTQIVDKWKCVKFFDMRYQSDLGYFLYNNYINNTRFPEVSFELDFRKYEYSKFYGIDYLNGVYVSKSKFLQNILYYEQPHFKLEKEILNSFKDNNLIFPHMLNMKFLFNDVPSTPDDVLNYSLNRYYGFYIDKLEFVTNLTSYITPELRTGYTLKNNIFVNSNGEPDIFSPFVEGFKSDKKYWIQYENEFYQVVKVLKNDIYCYQVISDFDMSGITFTQVNNRSCIINYQSENKDYVCENVLNPSGYTNFISGYTIDFKIDPYYENGNIETMFADLYLIDIDGIYHVLKKRDNYYFIQSDYAINSYPDKLEYWKGGKNSEYYVNKSIYTYSNKPMIYPVYRLRFSDIKDFDFNRVNTHFSDFEYEKDRYYITPEHKLYAVDYNNISVLNKEFMTHSRGEDGQYQIINVSSEYIADDELYEISFNNLTDIWRKNQSVVKWGYAGSNSNCDYPYKLNNSIDIGDVYNRTCNVKSNVPIEIEKSMNYFYRIGNFFSGSTDNIIRYFNQTTNIEVDFMPEFSKKFNLDLYLKSEIDYFTYFFENKCYYQKDGLNYIKPTYKYSVFEAGDKYSASSTIFKGLNINAVRVNEISRDSSGKILNIITNYAKNFNGYKFSIILNDVYEYYNGTEYVGIYENGLTGNTVLNNSFNGIHVFLNEKFKNFLIIINVKIPIQQNLINLNNVPVFGETYGLYNSKKLNGESLVYPANITKEYNPSLISASNFIDAFDDMNTNSEFDSGITYYYINSLCQSGTTGPINISTESTFFINNMTSISDWNKKEPPFILIIDEPEVLETKKQSYIKGAIRGPSTNIYDKYRTYYDPDQKQKYNIIEPLARYMNLNIQENNLNTVYVSNTVSEPNKIYRYNGAYEPIFLNIPIFNTTYLYLSGDTGKSWDSNYKFDTSYENFGKIEELIFSKVNPFNSPLKLKDTDKDRSVYPMVDEYGYQFNSRFIFNSSWDIDFYLITNSYQKTVFPIYEIKGPSTTTTTSTIAPTTTTTSGPTTTTTLNPAHTTTTHAPTTTTTTRPPTTTTSTTRPPTTTTTRPPTTTTTLCYPFGLQWNDLYLSTIEKGDFTSSFALACEAYQGFEYSGWTLQGGIYGGAENWIIGNNVYTQTCIPVPDGYYIGFWSDYLNPNKIIRVQGQIITENYDC